ncbi:glycosyltransferase family 39 protein [Mycobacterium sp. MYCO198283]|uniref:ArnT family glycosyltransferase n=1 Tax=Mycobacterium sp. MYCO198283 TaxID=2883505 RepID=UPI001E55BD65|nr:glycosyltransferase family 39 protein [Mycobacterium sp. MYCO198283]MCG5432930.1 glycosyltransferase family 39 protein [Mycobacterium sp. MYCO198283]
MTVIDRVRPDAGPGDADGPPTPARWLRPAYWALLAGTAVLYLWGLGASKWGNEFYAAAVQAGTQNWTALLFGSLDPGNTVTVDKPPAALWVMGLSGRLFGFNTWSMLVPQALMGVAAVALLYAAVNRVSGPVAGLLAGSALALTPVAALMFRYNNPDALLVLLLVAAAYCTVRAVEGSTTRWMVIAGTAIGFAFLTKMLQAFLTVPALALVVLVAAPGGWWRRVGSLAAGAVAMIVSGGWFVALVSLWPAASRPYIGGSTDNSLLELALGYNGLGRVFGGDGNPTSRDPMGGPPEGMPGGPPEGMPGGEMPGGGSMFGGHAGITRMFGESMGTEISWLLPAALIGLIAGVWFTRRAPRTDRTRAALLLWGGWLLVTALVFSFMKGIMHPYYTVALAPAVAAVVALTAVECWRGRARFASRLIAAVMLAATGAWNFVLLDRTPEWQPWLRWVVLVAAILLAAVIAVGGHRLGRYTAALAVAGVLVGLAGTAAYTVETVAQPHGGGIPTSGPARADGMRFPGGPGGPGGGRFGGEADNAALQDLLTGTGNRWAAATVGSHLAGSLQLSTGKPVMAIGGFNGGDPAPTLEQFQRYVADGDIGYFLVGQGPGGGGPGGQRGTGSAITAWVAEHFTPHQVGNTTVYDLRNAAR